MKRALIFLFAVSLLIGPFATQLPAATVKDWTWMVFINADNNLDEYGVLDQEEMSKVGSNDWLNIVTLIDRYDGPASWNLIEKGKVTLLRDCGELDMGDWKQLVSFVRESIERFPAKRYSLVIWNHGSGWKKKAGAAIKGISYDDHSNNHITTAQLAEAMGEIKHLLGRNLDLLCMDACLMQMMEVAWPLRASCDYIVASEETVPGDGFPYHTMLGGLTPGMTIPEFGKVMTKAFYDCYNHDTGGYGGDDLVAQPRRDIPKTTLSMLDCTRIEPLKDALDELARVLMAGSFASPLRTALTKVQSFSYSTNIDLTHLIELLQTEIKTPEFKSAAVRVREALKAAIVASQCTGYNPATGEDDPAPDARSPWPMPIDANGLAIYFPAQKWQFAGEYLELAFARESLWNELIFDFYAKAKTLEILADLDQGRSDALRAFVRETPAMSVPWRLDLAALERKTLIDALNFRFFSETNPRSLGSSDQAELLGLLSTLQRGTNR